MFGSCPDTMFPGSCVPQFYANPIQKDINSSMSWCENSLKGLRLWAPYDFEEHGVQVSKNLKSNYSKTPGFILFI